MRSLTEHERAAFAAVKQLRLALPAERTTHASTLAAATQAADAAAAAAKAGRNESAEALRLRAATSAAANECAFKALPMSTHLETPCCSAAQIGLDLTESYSCHSVKKLWSTCGRCACILKCAWHPALVRVRWQGCKSSSKASRMPAFCARATGKIQGIIDDTQVG